jgi:hypothetical protein
MLPPAMPPCKDLPAVMPLVIPPVIVSDPRPPLVPDCWLLPAAPLLLVSVIALVGVLVPPDVLDEAIAAPPRLPIARRIAEFIGGCDTRPLGAEAPPRPPDDEAMPPLAPAPAPALAPACSKNPMTIAPIMPVSPMSIASWSRPLPVGVQVRRHVRPRWFPPRNGATVGYQLRRSSARDRRRSSSE